MSAVHRLTVGAVECALLDDGNLAVVPEVIFPRNDRRRWPRIDLDGERRLVLSVNCLLIRSSGRTILVDTGNGNRPGARFPGAGQLLHALAAEGTRPEEVDVVLLTHPHGDHVGGTTVLREGQLRPAFPRARHVLARADWEHVTVHQQPAPAHLPETLLPLTDWGLLDLVEPDVAVTPEVSYLSAPGHTPGNAVVRVQSGASALEFLGDLVHHTAEIEDPELIADGDVRPDLVPGARRRVFERVLADDALVAASHLPFPGVGRLVGSDGSISFRPLG